MTQREDSRPTRTRGQGGSTPPSSPPNPVLPGNAAGHAAINQLQAAEEHDRDALAHLVSFGDAAARARSARETVASAVSAAQGLVGQVVVPSGLIGPAGTAVATPEPPAPVDATQQQPATPPASPPTTAVTSNKMEIRRFGIAILAGVIAAIVTLVVWSAVVDDAAGDGGWADNGGLKALIAIVIGIAVALIASTFGPDDEQQQTEVTVTQVHLHPDRNPVRAAPAAAPPAPGS